jgi:hypothetical protein
LFASPKLYGLDYCRGWDGDRAKAVTEGSAKLAKRSSIKKCVFLCQQPCRGQEILTGEKTKREEKMSKSEKMWQSQFVLTRAS